MKVLNFLLLIGLLLNLININFVTGAKLKKFWVRFQDVADKSLARCIPKWKWRGKEYTECGKCDDFANKKWCPVYYTGDLRPGMIKSCPDELEKRQHPFVDWMYCTESC